MTGKRKGAGGRPRSGSVDAGDALEPLHVRVGVDQRARWRTSVAECGDAGFEERTESAWVRAGLDAFAEVCAVAVRDKDQSPRPATPGELVAQMLELHERVRVLVAGLEGECAKRALSDDEDRIFRRLMPAAWERASRAGALTVAPAKRASGGR